MFLKMSVPLNLYEISRLVNICRKILILATIFENLDFYQNVLKLSRFLSKFSIISYLVQISDNLDFVQNFRKITISLKIFKESRFWSKLFKISILVNLYRKS